MSQRLVGMATPAGTIRGSESFGAGARRLGRTGLTVSPVGFGAHRVRDDAALHRRALTDALRVGVNLIDTAPNFTEGSSETLIGGVLANLVQRGELKREQVVVVTKVGVLQGQALASFEPHPDVRAEVVEYSESLWQCMHPEFVREQVERSAERMGLATIDVVLLQNPELLLAWAAKRGQTSGDLRQLFDERLRRAFGALEGLVAQGRIGWYGLASNGLALSLDHPAAHGVGQALDLAEQAGGRSHHFALVEFPMNLLELGAVLHRHDGPRGPQTPLQTAERADLGILVQRPLNAMDPASGAVIRLAQAPKGEGDADVAASQALAAVRKLEAQWASGLGKRLVTEDGDNAVDLFRWGQELTHGLAAIGSPERWRHLRHDVIAGHLGKTSAELLKTLQGNDRDEFARWWATYGTALGEAFEAIEAMLEGGLRQGAHAVEAALDPCLPPAWRSMTLSQKAVLAVLAAPVSSVLVGMRAPGYVHDITALREVPIRLASAAIGPIDFAKVREALRDVAR